MADLIEKFSFSVFFVGLGYIYSQAQAPKDFLPCGCLPSTLETCQISELCNFTRFTTCSHLPTSPLSLFHSISKQKYNPFEVLCHSFSPTPWLCLTKHVCAVSQPATDRKQMLYRVKKIASWKCIAPVRTCTSTGFNTF